MGAKGVRAARRKVSVGTWKAWLAAIEQDLYVLHADRHRWRETVKIVKANPGIPSPGYVMDWITRMYVSHVSSGIRRQLEESPKVVSLYRLLASIHRNPGLLTKADFVKASCAGDLDDEFAVRSATAHFGTYAQPGANHIDRARVKKDMDLLRMTGAKVKSYVDERIAHLDKAHADPIDLAKLAAPTFKELDEALSMLGKMLQKYYRLLTGASLSSAEPRLQHNWTLPFTVAWLPSEGE